MDTKETLIEGFIESVHASYVVARVPSLDQVMEIDKSHLPKNVEIEPGDLFVLKNQGGNLTFEILTDTWTQEELEISELKATQLRKVIFGEDPFIKGNEIEHVHTPRQGYHQEVKGHLLEDKTEVIVRFPDGYEEPMELRIESRVSFSIIHFDIMYLEMECHGVQMRIDSSEFDTLEFHFVNLDI